MQDKPAEHGAKQCGQYQRHAPDLSCESLDELHHALRLRNMRKAAAPAISMPPISGKPDCAVCALAVAGVCAAVCAGKLIQCVELSGRQVGARL
ncbi:MAG: hypothetical protein R2851_21010 [Caldilineaceae bacterium]